MINMVKERLTGITLGVAGEANGAHVDGGDKEGCLEREHQQDASAKASAHLHGCLLRSVCLPLGLPRY